MALLQPAARPVNPRFSSGPCAKPPTWTLNALRNAPLGRSHTARPLARNVCRAAIDGTRQILGVPDDHRIGIVPASDTGAFEMAMWNLLGERPAQMVAWDSFGAGWVTDAVQQLKINATVHTADYGQIVDMAALNYDHDVCFTWNGTTSGVRVVGDPIPAHRQGLTLCDATSAAFAMDLPWDKLDATTFSWQKVLGGEAAHGVLILSPRAVARLQRYTPPWPLPKIFRLTKGGKLIEGIFNGATINTPSMLCVEDYLFALDWARSVGGLRGLKDRAAANAGAIWDFCADHDWIDNLAEDPATRSVTSVCLTFTDPRVAGDAAFAKAVAGRLEAEGIAFDIGSYRDAPPGLRIWCGGTIELSDVQALLPWLTWAYHTELETFTKGIA